MTDHHILDSPTELLSLGYLRLSVYAMQVAGPAARTMAALYELADGRTRSMRVSIARIAALCGLPRRTVQRHLQFLERRFRVIDSTQTWGASRYRIDKVAWDARSQFRALPKWWAGVRVELQDWSTTATYAWLLSRACMVEKLEAPLDDLMVVTREEIAQITGLTRRSVSEALEKLKTHHCIDTCGQPAPDPTFSFQMRPVPVPRLNPAPRLNSVPQLNPVPRQDAPIVTPL